MWRKLKVYADAQHPHQAQKPAAVGAASTKNKRKREVA